MIHYTPMLSRSRYSLLALAAYSILVVACQSDVVQPVDPEFRPSAFDEQGALWTPLLAADTAVYASLPPPISHTASDVEAAVAAFQGASDQDRADIREWNAGALIRWNTIACDLVAKYNVAPFPERRPNGSFTGRFITDPQRPFATPPFASRLYALLSAAQYDAMIHCWRLKGRNTVKAPADQSAAFGGAAPATSWSSWPSEDAAVAAVSRAILSAMFPLEATDVAGRATAGVRSRVLAGRAWPEDVAAGDSIGMTVARAYLARMASDGYAQANDQQAWSALEKTIVVPYPRWKSMEIPSRPPMLPMFGRVAMWHVPSPNVVDPGPPHAEGTPQWNADLDEMRQLSKSRTREQVRIANFWEDGAGTSTPPGHWCAIAKSEILRTQLSPIRTARILAYTTTAMHDAAVVAWDIKYKYIHPRPHALDQSITMSAGLPNFPGYVSGHSAFSSSAATVLAHFFPDRASLYHAWAREAAESRIYSRIHLRVDCEVGVDVGNNVGTYSVQRAQQDP
jgi:membrane-associated phospholipid phosphatase